MTDSVEHSSGQRRLGDQGPAFTAMRKCVDLHSRDRRRGRLARFIGISALGADAIELFRAAEGELQVAEIVRALGHDWVVLNAVPIGSGHAVIDYSLIGPVGVVLITVRRHVGSRVMLNGESLTVDGIRVDHLRNAAYETERVQSALVRITGHPITVNHAVVLLGVDHVVHVGHKLPIAVLRPRDLGGWLRSLPHVFTTADIAAITTIAEQRVQWVTDASGKLSASSLVDEFQVIREHEGRAENRRRIAGVVTAVTVLVSGIAFLALADPTLFSIFAR